MQQHIFEGLQGQLEVVKGMYFAEMLAYRGALLDAAVSKGGCTRMGDAMAHILKVRPHNIKKAAARKSRMAKCGESEFSL